MSRAKDTRTVKIEQLSFAGEWPTLAIERDTAKPKRIRRMRTLTLPELRTEKGLEQSQVAAAMDSAQSHISRLESSGTNPSVATLSRVISAMGGKLRLCVELESGELVEVALPVPTAKAVSNQQGTTPSRSVQKPRRSFRAAEAVQQIAGAALAS